MENTTWYAPLRDLRSLGSQKEKIAHMGELAAQRRQHLGQFFTPDVIAALMWRIVSSLPIQSILDNSIGSARLLQFAEPSKHHLYGVDVHAETVDHVKEVISAAGFQCDILTAGMQDIRPRSIDLALINPPFSIHLESPALSHFHGCTKMGRFGPNSSAISDEYAVFQALDAASIVVALLPRSSADSIRARNAPWSSSAIQYRLRAVLDLPANAFKEEGANVETSVVVFGEIRGYSKHDHIQLVDLNDPLPDFGLAKALERRYGKPSLGFQHIEDKEPTITLPVTNDPSVTIALDGRRIKIGYQCGFTQARVANAILGKRIFSTDQTRLPRGVRYSGQGRLDLEVYLMQADPMQAFQDLLTTIRNAGGVPVVKPGVAETLRNKARRKARACCPMRHTVWSRGASSAAEVVGKATQTHNVDPSIWLSPVIKAGEEVQFSRQADGKFTFQKKGKDYLITADELENRFALQGVVEDWQVVHSGLREKFPQHAALLTKRAKHLGIDQWLTWEFQLQDTVELLMKPTGGIAAWKQACGKSRLAVALILLSGVKHGLIVLESRLIDEMVAQIRKLPIDMADVNVIDEPGKLSTLRRYNIIAYERLRMPVDAQRSKSVTYAKRLRRRIGLVTADEGERLSNIDSDQSRALMQLSARRRYVLSGTPISNYPRDIHGVLLFTSGDGNASQPYGLHHPYMEERFINSMEFASRGIDAIRNDFVVVEWCTWEFADTLREGAKREVPKIANVEKYRAWLAPHVKRRITEEPEVAKYIQLPKLTYETIDVDWDKEHLAFYLKAADDFAEWYKRSDGVTKNNLAVLLARLMAVQTALNVPQDGVDGMPAFTGLTSKQRAVIDHLAALASEGKKALVFTEHPTVVDIFHRELKERGVETVRFHGGIPIKKRVKDKDDHFVNGSASHLIATKRSARAGYNLPMADVVVFADRNWSHKNEDQAVRRPLRVERKAPVECRYFHIPGSLDVYQAQMVAFKKDSADAGLDWATPELGDQEFLHLSTILDRFIEEIASLRGMRTYEMRELLKKAA
jgi:hypothetical protein